ncbi:MULTISPECIES: hypothetical protein [unclassified Bartonella]
MADRASGTIEAAKQTLKTKQPLYVDWAMIQRLYEGCRELIAYEVQFLTKNSALAIPTYTPVNPLPAGHQMPHPSAPQNTFCCTYAPYSSFVISRILPL